MKLPAGVQIRILLQEFKGDDEITRQEVNFVTWRTKKNCGLDVSQHLNHFLYKFSTRKKIWGTFAKFVKKSFVRKWWQNYPIWR